MSKGRMRGREVVIKIVVSVVEEDGKDEEEEEKEEGKPHNCLKIASVGRK